MSVLSRILGFRAYTHVFEKWRGARILEFWGQGNVGDELIRRGAEQLYKAFEISAGSIEKGADVVFYGGGGNMGPLYPNTRRTREYALNLARMLGLPIVVLPQSWTGIEDFPADECFAREHWSLEFCPSAVLAPDLALAYQPAIELPDPRHGTGWFMRKDAERGDQGVIAWNLGDPVEFADTADKYIELASTYESIHTDRLHFAIAAMIAQRKVYLHANCYHKNEAMYHLWLKGRGCQWAASD